jgi:hypothetical protein
LLADQIGEQIVRRWLETGFDGGRHARRVGKIAALEDPRGMSASGAVPVDDRSSSPRPGSPGSRFP